MTKKTQDEKPDAVELLKSEHDRVKKAFQEFQELGPQAYVGKSKLADKICQDLLRHTAVEEEIFYPAFRKAVKESDGLADEALVEHQSARELIRKITEMDSKDDLFDAHMKVLAEYIEHHVQEEESEMFPAMQKSDVDLHELGERIEARNRELG